MDVMARNSRAGAAGEPDLAFEGLVRDRLPALLRLGMLLSSNATDAEDLVQATLTKAFAARRSVTAADDPAAYLSTIMINTSRSWRRRLFQERTLPAPDPTRGSSIAMPPSTIVAISYEPSPTCQRVNG
jgi:DNA-directed RNA polymerase specialized sigma24 family protein